MKVSELKALHKKSSTKEYIDGSKKCGCFYCLKFFDTKKIKKWVGANSNDALCPLCGIDSVLSDKMCELNNDTLVKMNKYFFGRCVKINK